MRPNTLTPLRTLSLALSLLVIFAGHTPADTTDSKTGILLMFKSTNFDQMIGTGIVHKISPSWAFVADGYTGGGQTGVQTQALLLIHLSTKSTLFFAAGPELSITQTTPTTQDKIHYIQAATTFGYNHHVSPDLCLFLAIDRLDGDAPTHTYKFSLGAVLWTP